MKIWTNVAEKLDPAFADASDPLVVDGAESADDGAERQGERKGGDGKADGPACAVDEIKPPGIITQQGGFPESVEGHVQCHGGVPLVFGN